MFLWSLKMMLYVKPYFSEKKFFIFKEIRLKITSFNNFTFMGKWNNQQRKG